MSIETITRTHAHAAGYTVETRFPAATYKDPEWDRRVDGNALTWFKRPDCRITFADDGDALMFSRPGDPQPLELTKDTP